MTTITNSVKIEFGTSQDEIVKLATNNGSDYVLIWHDHYDGNGKGYYQSVGNFAKSKIFQWNMSLDDRGAISVCLVSGDVPGLIEEKSQLVNTNSRLYAQFRKTNEEVDNIVGQFIRIDRRWSAANPKRIHALAINNDRKLWIEKRQHEINAEIDRVNVLLSKYNDVSSSFVELFI